MDGKWKFYFWFYIIFSFIGLFGFYGFAKSDSIKFGDVLGIINSVVAGIGLYSYVYKKKIFSMNFWRVIFWLSMINFILEILITYTPLGNIIRLPDFLISSTPESNYFISQVFGWITIFPLYFAIYKLGQKNN